MSDLTALQAYFTRQLPTLEKNARFHFRKLPPFSEAREEAIANAIGLCWMFIVRLLRKGRAYEPGMLNSCMRFAIKQTKEGRSCQGCPRAKDVLDGRKGRVTFDDAFDLNDLVSRSTPIPEAVSFRVDVPAFLRKSLSARDRKLAKDLAGGMSTTEAATKYAVSMGRISQFRRLFMEKFRAYMSAE